MTKTLFDHLNHIFDIQDKNYYDQLDDLDKKTFTVYMINRFVSMNPDYVPVVNELQQYWNQISPREVYLFYSQIFPKKKQFNKYIKSSKDLDDYEDWLLELISRHFKISNYESTEYLRIYYSSNFGKLKLRELLEGYGISPKQMKKVKL